MSTEIKMALLTLGVLLAVNFLALMLHFLYRTLSDGAFKDVIRNIIFELDRFADNMENAQKRLEAISQINDILGWRRILIPRTLIGWIIDTEVAAIRRMQKQTNTPNLHEGE